MDKTYVGTVVISGERNAYLVAAFVRDNTPPGGSHLFAESDLPELMGEPKEDQDLHELYEIDLLAEPGAEDAVRRFLTESGWERFEGVMWWEDMTDLHELDEATADLAE